MAKIATRARRIPQRTCIACRTTGAKRELVRIVRTPEGHVLPDATGKAAGRGAYLCRDAGCWEQATKKRLLDTALRVTVSSADAEEISSYGRSLAAGEVP
jgi:predicted RNA-binding protein YlxR (DUF448 family)